MEQEVRRFSVHVYPVVHFEIKEVEAYNRMAAIKSAMSRFNSVVNSFGETNFIGDAGHYLVDEFDDHGDLDKSIVVNEDDLKKWEAR